MKFGLLIETFFLKNHSHNVVVKLFHDPFLKDQTWTYPWINGLKVFIVCQVKGYLKTVKISHRSLAFTWYKTNKTESGTSLPTLFSAWLLNKNISLVIFYWLNKVHCLVAFTLWDIGQYVYFVCLSGCDIINFEIILIFQIKPFFQHDKKSTQNFKYLDNEKSF